MFLSLIVICFTPVVNAQTASNILLAVSSGGSSVTSVSAGSVATLTATAQAGGRPVTRGEVLFCEASAAYCGDIHRVGTAQLTANGTATLTFVPGPGPHQYEAKFVGTTTDAMSVSAVAELEVSPPGSSPSITSLTASGPPDNYTVNALVSGNAGVAPSGVVNFLNASAGNASLGTGTLAASPQISLVNTSVSTTGQSPRPIGVGDFNGDGILDMAIANRLSNTVTILIGKGDGTFTPAPVSPATGTAPTSIAVADFNSDGLLDLAVSNLGSATITILLGQGDGTFTAQSASPVTYLTPTSIVAADFNGDGIPDLAAVNYGSPLINILLGNGDGTFKPASVSPHAASYSQFLATADLNGDGVADLIVANTPSNNLCILLGNGDGTFTLLTTTPPTGAYPDGIAIADLNGDGIPDLAVANSGDGNSISILLGNGDGTFHQSLTTSVGSNPTSIAVADFNQDGIPDLAVADQGSNSLTVLLGKGDGTFTATTPAFPTGTQPIVVAAGDFNGDGVPDLATANNGDGTLSTFTVFGKSALASTSGIVVQVSEAVQVVAHYPGDTNYSASSASITLTLKSTPTVTITPSSISFTYGTPIMLSSSVTGVGAAPTGQVSFYAGTLLVGTAGVTNGTAVLTTSLIPGGSPSMTAKYSGDPNYLIANSSPVTVSVQLATPTNTLVSSLNPATDPAFITFTASLAGKGAVPTGSVTFYEALDTPWGFSLGTAKVDGNGNASLGVALGGGGFYISAVYGGDHNYGGVEADIGQAVIAPTQTNIAVQGVVSGTGADTLILLAVSVSADTDRQYLINVEVYDGTTDLGQLQMVTNGGASLTVAPGIGQHVFTAVCLGTALFTPSQSSLTYFIKAPTTGVLTISGSPANYALTAQVNGNVSGIGPTGTITFTDQTSNSVLGKANLGQGVPGLTSLVSSTPSTGQLPAATVVADFNGDGSPDIAIANEGSNSLTILLSNGDGTFSSETVSPATGMMPVSITSGDFNRDGIIDLAVANEGDSSVTILLGNGDGTFAKPTNFSVAFNPISIGSADFNRDGRSDLAVLSQVNDSVTVYLSNGNGTFSPVGPGVTTGKSPTSIAVGDLNGDGKADAVILNPGSNTITVLLGNGDGTFSSSALNLPNGSAPTAMSLADLDNNQTLDIAVANDVPNSNVTVFSGVGDGTFQSAVISKAALSAPSSITSADLNMDGIPDLIVSNEGSNSLSVLLGSGKLAFSPSTLSLTVGSKPSSVSAADFNSDGIPDIVATNGGSNTLSTLLIANESSNVTVDEITEPSGSGIHQVIASYSGDNFYSGNTSVPVSLSSSGNSAKIGLTISPNPAVYATPLTVVANVSGSSLTPTGAATFLDGASQLGTVELNSSGVATYSSSVFKVGQHQISVRYQGDSTYNSGASAVVNLTVEPISPTIDFSIPNKIYEDSPFSVLATSNSTGAITYSVVSGPATISGSEVMLTGIGSVVVLASQAAFGDYSTGSHSATFSVAPGAPSITFSIPNQTYGASPFSIGATSNSSGALTYSVVSGPAGIKGSTVSLTSIGTVTIKVSQAAAGDYTSGTQMATFKVAAAIPQINFPVPNQIYGTPPFKVTATSDSTGIFTYSVVSGSAQITGSTVTLTGKGTVVLKATQAASGNYQAGSQTVSFSVIPEAPEISFSVLNHAYGSAPFSVAAASNSSGAFTYSVVSGAASISDSTVTLKGVGSVVLKASQAAAGNYSAGSQTATFVVSAGVPTIKFAVAGKSYGVAPFTIAATSNSTGAIAYSHVSGPATVSGTTVTLTGVGTVVLKASQTAAGDYTAGSETASFAVAKGTQTIKFTTLPTAVIYGASGISLAATASSGLPVTYSVTGPATISASTLTINGAGSVKVTASQAGNSDYGAAPPVTKTIIVSRAVLTVTADNATRVYGAANPAFLFTLTGFVHADTAAKATTGSPLLTTTAAVKSAVGSYAITAAVGTLTATNYTFKYIAGVLSVTHAPLKVVVASATKVYGAAEPVFSGVVTGLLNGDVVTAKYSSTGLTSSAVGSYPITAALSGSALTNYTPTIVPATLTIGRAALTVKANSFTRAYDTANPVFTDVITGFVNGDKSTAVTGSAALTTTATLTSPVGTYPISAATGSLAAKNYTFTFVKGTLTITATSASLPVFSPDGRAYTTKQTVEITDATASTSIQYTTNGTKPTTSSSRYSFAITVAATETLEAIAIAAYPAKAKNQKAG